MNKKENRKEMLKQVGLLSIILVIVIVIAIVLNINTSKNKNNSNTINSSEDSEQYVINGITEETLESMKDLMDKDTYNEYKNLFEAYKRGEAKYVPESEQIKEEDKMTENEISNSLNEADQKRRLLLR